MKKVIFTGFLLAMAGLGLALPPNTKPAPAIEPTTNTKPAAIEPTPNTKPAPAIQPSVLTSGISVEAVQDGLKVSPNCAEAVFTLITSPEFLACVPIGAIAPLLPTVTDPNFPKEIAKDPAGTFKKYEPAFVKAVTDFCPVKKCSDQGIVGAVKLLSDGCESDLKDNNALMQMAFAAAVFYSPLHDIVCFKSANNNQQFCWDETITTVFGLPKSPIKVTGDPLIDSVAVSDCKTVCTDCNKNMINTLFDFIGDAKNPLHDAATKILTGAGLTQQKFDSLKLGVAVKCGISFEDGNVPNKPFFSGNVPNKPFFSGKVPKKSFFSH